ncbi:tyrosine-protein phosphatase non-receptor type 1-like [Trematomus bernacchii]|uniref:tyrosine-protein phosphatase non-receptor type 1-like n=1 Tax=Trematomus bernacchii TaxID=40690 RepID=UPI00146E1F2A|nr:tyrosine-protein phosphatase non-receptor type 1-like [Trematomus bernacchii]
MEAECREIDETGSWSAVYQEIRQQSCELPCKVAKLPENKNRNRYRDVSPFDHSRICLQFGTNNYINASLIPVEEAQRNYILTQGPLPNTCGSFWEMVWEQRSRGVVMLNRVVEKGSIKCAQYWPQREERDAVFEDTNFKLTFVSEDVKSYYTVRQLELENLSTAETREILHFHYTTWPDFGVPESPASFLNFLFKVRESGCLTSEGPVVVHCSAGIGRSGTFCLVDSCLLLMSARKDPSSVRIREVLLEMRRYRMGLIQTADQLRFSYLAVIEGAKYIGGDTSLQESWKELSKEEDEPPEFTPPPPPPPPRDPPVDRVESSFFPEHQEVLQQMQTCSLGSSQEPELRKRNLAAPLPPLPPADVLMEDPPSPAPPKPPRQQQHLEKEKLEEEKLEKEMEEKEEKMEESFEGPLEELDPPKDPQSPGSWPLLTNVCLVSFLAVGAYVCYRACFH